MCTSVFDAIRALLDLHGIAYRTVHHEPTRTSEESAQVRGEELKVGAKAILMKCDDAFRLFVISAAQRIDSKAIKSSLKRKSLRFATREELFDLTGLEPGAVPPFGRPILDFDLYADPVFSRMSASRSMPGRSLTRSSCRRKTIGELPARSRSGFLHNHNRAYD